MALMYPSKLPDYALSDPKRSSECRLFSLLKSNLPNDYTVFYSVAYQLKEKSDFAYDGEADFLIAHPKYGLLVIELKGGRIRYDVSQNQWYSEDRNNIEHLIKDPFAQARKNHYGLRRKLQEAPLTQKYRYFSGYAVCFPDIEVPANDLGLDAPRKIILDARDIQRLEQQIITIYNHWHSSNQILNSNISAIQALVDLIGRSWNFKSPLLPIVETNLLTTITNNLQITDEYTEQQFILLDHLQRFRKVLISGCAGSGKTYLAAEKATRLYKEGFSVLFLCWNEGLGKWMQSRLKDTGVKVNHINEFLRWFVTQGRKKGLRIPDRQVPTIDDINLALQAGVKPFDAIIVDEGQDFLDFHWVVLEKLLAENGIFYIFYDDNQRIYGKQIPFPIDSPPVILSVNCRNTREIHKFATNYYKSDHGTSCFLTQGKKPVFIDCNNDEKGKLAIILDRLVNQDNININDIVLLSPSLKGTIWENNLSVGKFRISHSFLSQTLPPNTIRTTTISKFKGLERGVVILSELHLIEQGLNFDRFLYIGISRARSLLIVLAHSQEDFNSVAIDNFEKTFI